MFPLLTSVLALLCTTASAVVLPRSSAVHLAVSPQCGTLSGGVPADVNVGLGPLSSYKTIVAFGGIFFSCRVGWLAQTIAPEQIRIPGAETPMDPPGCRTSQILQALN